MSKIKKLELPEGWFHSIVGQYTTRVQYGISKSMNTEQNGTPILRMNNLDGEGFLDLSNLKYVDISMEEIEKYSLEKGDILFNRVNSVELVGKTSIVGDSNLNLVFASYLIRVNVNDQKLTPNYLNYYMNSFLGKKEINRYLRRASGQANINAQELKSMTILVPPLQEQRKIISILSNVDTIIQTTQQLIDQLQLLKQGLMQRLFTEGVGHIEFKETRLGRIPNEWEIKQFKDIGDFQYGYTESAQSEPTKTKFVRITDINENGFLKWGSIPYVRVDDEETIEKYRLKKGDILFARIGATTGKTCFINHLDSIYIFASYLIRFKIDHANPKFVFFFTQASHYNKFVYANKSGKLKQGLNSQELRGCKILLPSIDEQNKISDILTNLEDKIINEMDYITKLQSVKKGLMQQLMTGKKRVPIN